ncbi:MAG TPA: TRAP transporter large permease [Pseudogracilibacillus sp.]|nr:TRAP transporter large permease [Pseudogracilibacillus sp.]
MLIAIVILIVTLLVGIPVPFSFFATAIYLIFTKGYDPSFLLPYGFGGLSSTVLLAIPLFIMAGGLMEKGGMGDKIINLVEVIFGRLKGGLGIVTVISCAVFGAISGSGAATMTTIGTILLPRLEKAGYPPGFSASLVASASVLGMLIPPSSLMILFAWVSSQSVLAAFLSTIIPGLIMIFFLSIINIIYLRNTNIKVVESVDIATKTKQISKGTMEAFPVILLAFIILGGIYGGIMTTTEAAGISVIYAIFVGFWLYKGLNGKSFLHILIRSATMTGVIMVMLFGSMILSRMFIMEDLPGKLTNLLLIVSENKIVILLMINLFLVIIGMLMDDVSGVLLSTPVLLPIAMNFGVDPIHFAAILSVNLGLGVVTPPAAPLLYLAGQMASAKINELMKPTTIIILFAWLPTLAITTYVPDVALFLPRLLLGY